MSRSMKVLVGGFFLAVGFAYGWRWYSGRQGIRKFHLTNDDLDYSDRSAEELISGHLIDLNSAGQDQMGSLGLSVESLDRLVENRPYRGKLELVSRMILSQDEYAAIKDKVSVAEAKEAVKIG